MHEDSSHSVIASVLAIARLRAVRTHLLDLHKALIDLERARYEEEHGRLETPQHALRVVMADPSFAWLRPLLQLIVQIDERLADKKPLTHPEVDVFFRETRALLREGQDDAGFHEHYRRVLQDVPSVVMMHGRLIQLLDSSS